MTMREYILEKMAVEAKGIPRNNEFVTNELMVRIDNAITAELANVMEKAIDKRLNGKKEIGLVLAAFVDEDKLDYEIKIANKNMWLSGYVYKEPLTGTTVLQLMLADSKISVSDILGTAYANNVNLDATLTIKMYEEDTIDYRVYLANVNDDTKLITLSVVDMNSKQSIRKMKLKLAWVKLGERLKVW